MFQSQGNLLTFQRLICHFRLFFFQVYDIAANAWSSIVIPEQFRTSDHASFSNKRFLYIAGGFGQGYNETNVVYRIDTETFRIEIVASLPVARGAIASTQTSDYAFLAGGYKNCDASRLVERFDFATGLWTRLPSLNEPRGNANLVVLNGIVIIYGGERDMASGCNATHSEKVDWNISVEVLGSDVWKLVNTGMEIPRFQSASVAIDTTIFTFGGHLSYESDCRCYPNSDGVMSYRQLYHQVVELVDAPTNVPTSLPPNLTVSNDRCADGVKLEVVPEGMNGFAPVFGTTVGASVDLDAPTCNGVAVNHPGVWFQVTSPTDGTLTAQSCGRFSDFDIQLSVYQGSCHQLMCVAADDDSCGGNQARVTWEGERGQVYYLLVHGWVGVGNYQVSVQVREPPNDTCNYAQGPLPIGSSVEGSTTFASRDMMVQTCGGISYGAVEGVWYSVIGTGNVLVADSCADATDYDTKIHVFAGTCGDLECIGGNDNSAECGSLTNHQSLVRWYVTTCSARNLAIVSNVCSSLVSHISGNPR